MRTIKTIRLLVLALVVGIAILSGAAYAAALSPPDAVQPAVKPPLPPPSVIGPVERTTPRLTAAVKPAVELTTARLAAAVKPAVELTTVRLAVSARTN